MNSKICKLVQHYVKGNISTRHPRQRFLAVAMLTYERISSYFVVAMLTYEEIALVPSIFNKVAMMTRVEIDHEQLKIIDFILGEIEHVTTGSAIFEFKIPCRRQVRYLFERPACCSTFFDSLTTFSLNVLSFFDDVLFDSVY